MGKNRYRLLLPQPREYVPGARSAHVDPKAIPEATHCDRPLLPQPREYIPGGRSAHVDLKAISDATLHLPTTVCDQIITTPLPREPTMETRFPLNSVQDLLDETSSFPIYQGWTATIRILQTAPPPQCLMQRFIGNSLAPQREMRLYHTTSQVPEVIVGPDKLFLTYQKDDRRLDWSQVVCEYATYDLKGIQSGDLASLQAIYYDDQAASPVLSADKHGLIFIFKSGYWWEVLEPRDEAEDTGIADRYPEAVLHYWDGYVKHFLLEADRKPIYKKAMMNAELRKTQREQRLVPLWTPWNRLARSSLCSKETRNLNKYS